MKKNYSRLMIILLAVACLAGCSIDKGTKEYNQGIAAMKSGNYEEACKLIGTAIGKYSEEPLYYINYATTLVQLKRYGEAVSSYQKAITQGKEKVNKENNKRAYRGLGIAYYYQKKYKEAEMYLKKALDISELPDLNLDTYLYLGASQEILNEMKEACTTYGSALSLNPSSINAYVGKYKAEIALSKYEDAEDTLDKGLRQTPETAEDKYMFALLQFYHGDYNSAVDVLEASVDTYPESNLYLGQIYVQNKKYKKAIEKMDVYRKSTNDDKNLTLCKQMSECYMKLENYKKAIYWIELGIEQTKDEVQIQDLCYDQVVAYENTDQIKKAYNLTKEYALTYPNDDRFANKEKELEKNPAVLANGE